MNNVIFSLFFLFISISFSSALKVDLLRGAAGFEAAGIKLDAYQGAGISYEDAKLKVTINNAGAWQGPHFLFPTIGEAENRTLVLKARGTTSVPFNVYVIDDNGVKGLENVAVGEFNIDKTFAVKGEGKVFMHQQALGDTGDIVFSSFTFENKKYGLGFVDFSQGAEGFDAEGINLVGHQGADVSYEGSQLKVGINKVDAWQGPHFHFSSVDGGIDRKFILKARGTSEIPFNIYIADEDGPRILKAFDEGVFDVDETFAVKGEGKVFMHQKTLGALGNMIFSSFSLVSNMKALNFDMLFSKRQSQGVSLEAHQGADVFVDEGSLKVDINSTGAWQGVHFISDVFQKDTLLSIKTQGRSDFDALNMYVAYQKDGITKVMGKPIEVIGGRFDVTHVFDFEGIDDETSVKVSIFQGVHDRLGFFILEKLVFSFDPLLALPPAPPLGGPPILVSGAPPVAPPAPPPGSMPKGNWRDSYTSIDDVVKAVEAPINSVKSFVPPETVSNQALRSALGGIMAQRPPGFVDDSDDDDYWDDDEDWVTGTPVSKKAEKNWLETARVVLKKGDKRIWLDPRRIFYEYESFDPDEKPVFRNYDNVKFQGRERKIYFRPGLGSAKGLFVGAAKGGVLNSRTIGASAYIPVGPYQMRVKGRKKMFFAEKAFKVPGSGKIGFVLRKGYVMLDGKRHNLKVAKVGNRFYGYIPFKYKGKMYNMLTTRHFMRFVNKLGEIVEKEIQGLQITIRGQNYFLKDLVLDRAIASDTGVRRDYIDLWATRKAAGFFRKKGRKALAARTPVSSPVGLLTSKRAQRMLNQVALERDGQSSKKGKEKVDDWENP